MKIFDYPETTLLYDRTEIKLKFENESRHEVLRAFEGLQKDVDYELILRPKRKKRSQDANSYMWVLITKLSERLHKPLNEVYREFIKDNGVSTVLSVKTDAMGEFKKAWESNGIGWVCIELGESKSVEGWSFVKAYYGSSTYNTSQMSRVIDAIVEECKEQGIETLTPSELQELKENWK